MNDLLLLLCDPILYCPLTRFIIVGDNIVFSKLKVKSNFKELHVGTC